MKNLVLAAAVLMAATSAAMAQGYGYGGPYGAYRYGTYDYAPGDGLYDSAPGYGAYGNNGYDFDRVDGPGRGNSAESQR